MRYVLGLVVILMIVAVLGANVRGVISEPATSTTAVAATSALGTAVVIQQLNMCLIPLAVLAVIALAIVAWMMWRKEYMRENETRITPEQSGRITLPDRAQVQDPVRVIRTFKRHSRGNSRAAMRMFGK